MRGQKPLFFFSLFAKILKMGNNVLLIFQKLISLFLTKGIKILSIFVGAYFINFFIQKILKEAITKGIKNGIQEEEKKKRIETLISAFGGSLRFIIWIVAILMIVAEFGINIGPILASLGILGFAIGMAAKDTVADFISGFFILLEGQYKVGDRIKIGNIEGKVVDFNLRRTIIKDENGFLHFYPNSQIKIVARKIE